MTTLPVWPPATQFALPGDVLEPDESQEGLPLEPGPDEPPPSSKARGPRRPRKVTPALEQQAAAMAGGGTPHTQIATALGVHRQTVARILNQPHLQDVVRAVREAIQMTALKGIRRTTKLAYDRLHETVQPGAGDPKGFSFYAKGLESLERTAASASTLRGATAPEAPTDLRAEASELVVAVLRGLTASKRVE